MTVNLVIAADLQSVPTRSIRLVIVHLRPFTCFDHSSITNRKLWIKRVTWMSIKRSVSATNHFYLYPIGNEHCVLYNSRYKKTQ